MQLISRKELLEKFELQQNQMTQIKVEGNFSIEMNFSKFSYNIEEDNLKISDMMSNNFIVFSLNDINFMGIENNEISCILNDKNETMIKIK